MKRDEIIQMIEVLAERFPVFERRQWEAHWPLKIGAHEDIWQQWPDVDRKALSAALGMYCRRRMYLLACIAGGDRFDVNGDPCGSVTADEIDIAKKKLAEIDAARERAAEKAAAERRQTAEVARAQRRRERTAAPTISTKAAAVKSVKSVKSMSRAELAQRARERRQTAVETGLRL